MSRGGSARKLMVLGVAPILSLDEAHRLFLCVSGGTCRLVRERIQIPLRGLGWLWMACGGVQ